MKSLGIVRLLGGEVVVRFDLQFGSNRQKSGGKKHSRLLVMQNKDSHLEMNLS